MNAKGISREGIIIKGIGGFYYVLSAGEVFECKARGSFRKQKLTPLAGDRVSITVSENAENTIDRIEERSNNFLRPPVANVSRLIIIASVSQPNPVLYLIDKLTAVAVDKGVEPVVVFSKTDLCDAGELSEIYKLAGISVFQISSITGEGLDELSAYISDGINVFTGNSGVGKSSILNRLCPELGAKTGEISMKLGRGRHTTREVELFEYRNGFIADTPGFSSFDTENTEIIIKENLPFCFPEFLPYLGTCRFSTCTHTVDKGCKILEALNNGDIHKSRHDSYVAMYNGVKDFEEWKL